MLGQWSVAIFSSNAFTVRAMDQANVRGRDRLLWDVPVVVVHAI